ncbi:MAG: hypothetical protein JWQ02_1478 [Capsulimonas sp.]|nr:hypothetical protein [Capsulimonas sp.]
MGKFQTDEEFRQDWARRVAQAQSRPMMYVGNPDHAHRLALSSVLRLVWLAKIFRNPSVTRIILSPNQFLIRCETGPLIRPVQSLFTWGGGYTLSEPWEEERQTYFERINREDEARGLPDWRYRSNHGWRYCFSGATGPRLFEPSNILWMSKHFAWGLKTDAGLWCETYEAQWPVSKPFLVPGESKYGIFAMGNLDPERCSGLPYDAEDVAQLTSASRIRVDRKYGPMRYYDMGEIRVELCEEDFLQPEDFRLPGLAAWV